MKSIIEAHKFCTSNYDALKRGKNCGCFYCVKIFDSFEIDDYIIESDGSKTALCPYCDIDSVIGKGTGYGLSEEFLEEMRQYWF